MRAMVESGDAKFDDAEEALNKPRKAMDDYEKIFSNNTEFFSTYNPDMIEDAIIAHLSDLRVEPDSQSAKKYKIKFSLSTKDPDAETM